MYHATLRIGLFGAQDGFADAIRRIEPLDRFDHRVVEHPAISADALATCDIAIIDTRTQACALSHPSDSSALITLAKQRQLPSTAAYAAVVFVVKPEEAAALTTRDLSIIDALWVAPLNDARIAFEFGRLQKAAKQDAELRFSRTCLDTAIDSTPELIWFKDTHGSHLKVNEAFCETVDKTKEQVEGRSHYYIWDITPDEYAQGEYVCMESEEETMRARRTCLFDEQVKTKRGMRQFKTYKSPLLDFDDTVMGTVGIAHDVTDLGNIATELDILINALPFSVIIEDANSIILNANTKTEEFFGVKRHDMVGGKIKEWRRIVFGDKIAEEREHYEPHDFTGCVQGVIKAFELSRTPIIDVFGNKTGQLRIYRDVTAERELEERVAQAARTDYLTGLHNRRYFYEYFDACLQSEPLTVITLDLDKFKGINDCFGHAAGDKALVYTAQVLREAFPDGFVARWGGDEFVIALFGDADICATLAAVEDLIARLERESALTANLQSFSASAGVAKGNPAALDELIKRSDAALYRAKRSSTRSCCIDEELA